jgi:hypothetical protein
LSVAKLSADLGVVIPADLAHWLEWRTVRLESGKKVLTTGSDDQASNIEYVLASHPVLLREGFLPVIEDVFGNVFALSQHHSHEHGTPVVFFDHDLSLQEPHYVVASTLWMFLRFLFEREGELLRINTLYDPDDDAWSEAYDAAIYWPFDRARVLAVDPELQRCGAAALPWEKE